MAKSQKVKFLDFRNHNQLSRKIKGQIERRVKRPFLPGAALIQGFLIMPEVQFLRNQDKNKNTQKRETCFRNHNEGQIANRSCQNKNYL